MSKAEAASTADCAAAEAMRARAQDLPDWLRGHLGRVVSEARRLAQRYELDPDRVAAAAWGHDLFRAQSDAELLRAAEGLGLPIGPVERAKPLLLHGPVAAATARQAWSIEDAEVLEAMHWHTTAHPGMSLLATTVFLADKIEPEKLAADPDLRAVRDLAESDPESALLSFLERDLAAHLSAGRLVHPSGLEARNALLMARAAR